MQQVVELILRSIIHAGIWHILGRFNVVVVIALVVASAVGLAVIYDGNIDIKTLVSGWMNLG